MLLKLLRQQRFQASPLDLVVQLTLQLLASHHLGLPAFNSHLEFLKRAKSRRNDCAKDVPFPSSSSRVESFMKSSPRLLPRVGNNVVCFLTTGGNPQQSPSSKSPSPLNSFTAELSQPAFVTNHHATSVNHAPLP